MQFTDPTRIDYVDPKTIVSVPVNSEASCERVVITTADGRVFDLGKPTSILFPLRRALYLWRRSNDLKGARA